jgi:prepilin-type N-terminal cleavage/methylation domain-containing protein/prepilin-type processing-associated H-X9-DG protein
MRRSSRRAFTLLELLVVSAIITVLAGILVPAVQKVRDASAKAKCANNMRQIGMALHAYHDANGAFPSGLTFAPPTWYWSWMARILPYSGQETLYDQAYSYATATGGYTSFYNPVESTPVPLYVCPVYPKAAKSDFPTSDPATIADFNAQNLLVAFTTYLGVAGVPGDMTDPNPAGVLFRNSKVRLSQITDGASRTFMVGERPPSPDELSGWWFAGAGYDYLDYGSMGMSSGVADSLLGAQEFGYLAWVNASYAKSNCPPSSVNYQKGNPNDNCDQVHFWSLHPQGSNFLFADGSVHFITYQVDQTIFTGMCTINGGEPGTLP